MKLAFSSRVEKSIYPKNKSTLSPDRKLTFLDKIFWLTESDDNPKHVATLQILTRPEKTSPHYIDDFVNELRTFNTAVSPFNMSVKSFLGYPMGFIPMDLLDMDYHVKQHTIADMQDKKALHQKIAQLHEIRLDSEKPLWQFHLIESKNHRDYAIYIKIHHMLGDGVTLVRWLQAGYNTDADEKIFIPIWAKPFKAKKMRKKTSWFLRTRKSLVHFLMASKDFIWILVRVLLKGLSINTHYMPVPFTGTKTILTGQVKSGRVMSTLDLPFEPIKQLSKTLRASVNEILLCCFDIGVHRFLNELGQPVDKALFTNMPINLRRQGESNEGNMIAIVPVKLAHAEKDPYLRLRQIIENHRIVLKSAKKAHPKSFAYYTVFIHSFSLLYEMLNLSDKINPIANILISNIQGPKKNMYLKDSLLQSVYPVSTMTPGGGINITLMTYNNTANIGMVCCNKEIKSLEPLAVYFKEAFDLLESSVNDTTISIDNMGELSNKTDYSDIVELRSYSK
jgi:WS/DGAT/MGAT family acyltransferase